MAENRQWSIKQWAYQLERSMNATSKCSDCAPGCACVKHDDRINDSINGLCRAVRRDKEKKGK